jgi:hypothetical protein
VHRSIRRARARVRHQKPGLFLSALLALAGLFVSVNARAETAVWVERSTTKIRPSATPGTTTRATLSAAKNEFESFQIVVRAPEGVTGIAARSMPLTGPGGATIPAGNVRLYRVELINLSSPSDAAGATGRWPDALVPAVDDLDGTPRSAFPFNAAPNDARAIWVDILVPQNAVAGTYTGNVVLSGSGIDGVAVPVTLRVRNFALPSTATMRTYFQLNDLTVCEGHYNGDPSCTDWGTLKMDLIDKYARLALDHRLTLGNIYYATPSGSDWSEFDARYGPLFDGTAATRLHGAKLTSANFELDLSAANLSSFAQHMRAKGWLDRAFDYTADEPGSYSTYSDIASRAAMVHANAPGLRTLVTVNFQDAQANGVDQDIDLWVPIIEDVDGDPSSGYSALAGDQSATYRNLVSTRGDIFWTYQSCESHGCGSTTYSYPAGHGYPSYMIDHSATRNRAMEWASFRAGATGELYWETSYAYMDDAWSSQFYFSGNGDGTLFYPGTPAKVGGTGQTPVASQRLKHMRDGLEDYEYLAMVSKLGDPAFAKAQAMAVAPSAYLVGDDPTAMEAAREALATRIEQLLGTSTPPPPPPAMDGGTTHPDGGTTTHADAGTTTHHDAGTTTHVDAGTTHHDAGTTAHPDAAPATHDGGPLESQDGAMPDSDAASSEDDGGTSGGTHTGWPFNNPGRGHPSGDGSGTGNGGKNGGTSRWGRFVHPAVQAELVGNGDTGGGGGAGQPGATGPGSGPGTGESAAVAGGCSVAGGAGAPCGDASLLLGLLVMGAGLVLGRRRRPAR